MCSHLALTRRCSAGRCGTANTGPATAFLADESGKISIISIPVFVFVGVMAAFLVNTGQTVREKIRLQTAADAGAATATLWMARSMNAVTATNHMLGEATAVLAIFDGFGGPMLYELHGGEGMACPDSKRLNGEIEDYEDAIMKKGGVVSPYFAELDRTIVDTVKKLLIADGGKHRAGAAIYDGKLTLKHLMCEYLMYKTMSNVALQVGIAVQKTPAAPLGMGIEGLAVAAHGALTLQIGKIGNEWVVLDALEKVVGAANSGGLITDPIANVVVRGLSVHADTVLGRSASGKAGEAPMVQAIERSLDGLAGAHGVESLTVRPAPKDIRLPLVVEPPSPSADVRPATAAERDRLGPWEQPRRNSWSGEYEANSSQDVTEAVRKVLDPLKDIFDILDPIVSPFRGVSDLLKSLAPSWLEEGIEVLDLIGPVLSIKLPPGWKSNLNPCYVTATEERLRVPAFHWNAESRSQWVRATHPYVDDLRGGIVRFLREQAPLSNAATHYVHWTDRYTLVRAHTLRAERPADDPAKKPGKKPGKGPLDALLAEVKKLRKRFNDALDVDPDQAPDTPADFEAIADDLLAVVQRVGGTVEMAKDWLARVTAMPGEIGSAGENAAASPPEDIDPEDARALAEQLTRIALLEELLSLAESLADLVAIGPPHMYVIQGMDGTNKGDEAWTKDPRLAGRIFGVLVTAEDTPEPRLFDRGLFRTPTGRRRAWAGALVANGNGIRAGAKSGSKPHRARQVDTGWDTLNWEPTVEAWEWGDHPPRDGGASPVQALTGAAEAGRKARVRLGWDGLLVPIQGFGLRDREPAGDAAKADPFADFPDLLVH